LLENRKRRRRNTGTFDKSNGYARIKKEGKYIHRLIMEKFLGRKLLRTEQVHHKNKNKLDNRIGNLIIVTAREHLKLHKTKYPIIEEIKKECGNCHEIKYLREFNIRKTDLGYFTNCRNCIKMQHNIWKERTGYKKINGKFVYLKGKIKK